MKIIVTTGENDIRFGLPTGLILGRGSAALAQHMAKKYSPEVNLPDGALPALCDELRRIKKKYGTWDLVEMETASGQHVKITL